MENLLNPNFYKEKSYAEFKNNFKEMRQIYKKEDERIGGKRISFKKARNQIGKCMLYYLKGLNKNWR